MNISIYHIDSICKECVRFKSCDGTCRLGSFNLRMDITKTGPVVTSPKDEVPVLECTQFKLKEECKSEEGCANYPILEDDLVDHEALNAEHIRHTVEEEPHDPDDDDCISEVVYQRLKLGYYKSICHKCKEKHNSLTLCAERHFIESAESMYESQYKQYICKCSGFEVEEPDEEGVKHDNNKPRYDLIPADALASMVDVLTFGADKYGDRNWEKGMAWTRLFAASMRHLWAWMRGEDLDPETGLPHTAHAMCCCMFLTSYMLRKDKHDDRPQ